jgi:hypothetical protein
MRGPRHKRYLLLLARDSDIGEEAKKELTRRMTQVSPTMAKKAVWFDRAVIVKTDNVDLPMVKDAMEKSAGGVTLRSELTSGSIGKLKKAVSG